jgi:hypothetical protein
MKLNLFLYLLTFMVILSCNQQNLNNSKIFESELQAVGPGGEINIDVVTWGDPPIWLEISDDSELERLLTTINSINESDLKVSNVSVFELTKEDWDKIVQNINESSTEDVGGDWSRKNTVKFSDDNKLNFSFDDLQSFRLNDKMLTELDINYFKVNYPKSYSLRNFPGDSYKQNFMDYTPNIYDHVRLRVENSLSVLNFRFIDGNLINVSLE